MIDILKGRNPFKSGSPFRNSRNRAILEYNNWIKTYCQELGLSVLDLEGAVRYSEKNRFLREDLGFSKYDWNKFIDAIDYAIDNGAEIINLSIQTYGIPPIRFYN